jgi:hypothetical protein
MPEITIHDYATTSLFARYSQYPYITLSGRTTSELHDSCGTEPRVSHPVGAYTKFRRLFAAHFGDIKHQHRETMNVKDLP